MDKKKKFVEKIKVKKIMKTISDQSHLPAHVGDNVTQPFPDVDKDKRSLTKNMGINFRY